MSGLLTGIAPQYAGQAQNLASGVDSNNTTSTPTPQGMLGGQAPTSMPQGLSVPAQSSDPTQSPQDPMTDLANKLAQAATQGAQPYIQALSSFDPSTASDMNARLIQQKSSLLGGYNSTSDMSQGDFLDYMKNTLNLGNLAATVQKSPDQNVAYQQNIAAIKQVDPNAPNQFDSHYINVANIDANPVRQAANSNPTLAQSLSAPLSQAAVAGTDPNVAAQMPGGSTGQLVMSNQDGSYKVFQTTGDDGKQQFMVQNGDKVKTLSPDNVTTISAQDLTGLSDADYAKFKQDPKAYNQANFNKLYTQTYGYTPQEGVLIHAIQTTDDPTTKGIYSDILKQNLVNGGLQQKAIIDNEMKIAAQTNYLQMKKAMNGSSGTDLTASAKNNLQTQVLTNQDVIGQAQDTLNSLKPEDYQKYFSGQGVTKNNLAAAIAYVGGRDVTIPAISGDKTIGDYLTTLDAAKGNVYNLLETLRKNQTGSREASDAFNRLSEAIQGGQVKDPEALQTGIKTVIKAYQNSTARKIEDLKNNRLPTEYQGTSLPQDTSVSIAPTGGYNIQALMAEKARRAGQSPQQ